jgi:hypothetical protein
MAVKATKLVNRDVYEVTYGNSTGAGAITAVFENPENGDKSAYKGSDDGKFVVTVDPGYEGSDALEVTHDDGTVLDSGEVTFGG